VTLHHLIDGLSIIHKYRPGATVVLDVESNIPAIVIYYMNPGRISPTEAEARDLESMGFILYDGSASWGENEVTEAGKREVGK
jgi:hypothetical protein